MLGTGTGWSWWLEDYGNVVLIDLLWVIVLLIDFLIGVARWDVRRKSVTVVCWCVAMFASSPIISLDLGARDIL